MTTDNLIPPFVPGSIDVEEELKRFPADKLLHAFWRRKAPQPRPHTVPFNPKKAATRLKHTTVHGLSMDSPNYKMSLEALIWTREESLFWLQSLSLKNSILKDLQTKPPASGDVNEALALTLESRLLESHLPQEMSDEAICRLTSGSFQPRYGKHISPPKPVICALLNLLPFPTFIELWRDHFSSRIGFETLMIVREYLVPYITDEELEKVQTYLSERIEKLNWRPTFQKEDIPIDLAAAALFGMHETLLPIIEKIPDAYYAKATFEQMARPQILIFGLKDPALVIHHFERLKIMLTTVDDHISWIAHTGSSALTKMMKSSVYTANSYYYNNSELRDIITIITWLDSIGIAPTLFELSLQKTIHDIPADWIRNNPLETFMGLAQYQTEDKETALRRRKLLIDISKTIKVSELPSQYHELLAEVKEWEREIRLERKNKREVEQKARKARSDAIDREDSKGPEWLEKIFAENPGPATVPLPAWLNPNLLPQIKIEEYSFSGYKTNRILAALISSSPDAIDPLLVRLRSSIDRSRFDHFVAELFDRWMDAFSEPKEKWCLFAVGILGSDSAICQLIPYIKEWRTGGAAARAALVIKCLTLCGSDFALMKLNEMSQSNSLKSLQHKAAIELNNIAEARGLSRDELADRIVPTLGLDENGRRIFDFGTRQFRFVLGEDLKPRVKNESGRVSTDLPKIAQSDDIQKAEEATKQWKAFKAQLRTVVKSQVQRLEQAMVTRRRWSANDFRQYILYHPLQFHLAKTLIWGIFDKEDKCLRTFRIGDEHELLDLSEQPTTLQDSAQIGIIHPLHISKDESRAWAELKADYGLKEIFPQLGRSIFLFTPEELKTNSFDRFQGKVFEAVQVLGILERRGWIRGVPEDGGCYFYHYKHFPVNDITAFLSYTGILVGLPTESELQRIEGILFRADTSSQSSYHGNDEDTTILKLKDVDPITASEALTDLILLLEKAMKS
ncbi:MAG: DUF4132 domain-containing protein [Candidatus Obscuribacter sp.]|nr:DUF4132 domain-containing protein [Candidatus Obscuribacter sp.]